MSFISSDGCCLARGYATYHDSENSKYLIDDDPVALSILLWREELLARWGCLNSRKMVIYIMADLLAKEGISAEIINLRSIRPLDNDTIKASDFPAFGVDSEICAQIVEREAFENLDAPLDVPTYVFLKMFESNGLSGDLPARLYTSRGCIINCWAVSCTSRPVTSKSAASTKPTFVKALVALIRAISANRDSKGDEDSEKCQKTHGRYESHL
ncbi:hypothetical protein F4604DRAFT_1925985 [Suillus subluteus]|nr:hypothetical protein F4604DRAFT_1925985 [Suillus subluteus]